MVIRLVSHVYRRRWRQPLHTAHGVWQWRQGLLVKLEDGLGRVGYGEIAPLPSFGSETLALAQDFCAGLGPTLTIDDIRAIPDRLPATQFALASALEQLQAIAAAPLPTAAASRLSLLLPPGEAALEAWSPLWQEGIRTFKVKLGIAPGVAEMALVQALVAALPAAAHLRLDANGSLSLGEASQWLSLCDRLRATPDLCTIDYLEQPLAPSAFPLLQSLAQRFHTPVALDESVATYHQLENLYRQGWPGLFIVKPAIAGFPGRLRQIWAKHRLTLVFSSVFETSIGRRAVLALAAQYQQHSGNHLALGLGARHSFEDDWDDLSPDQLWQRL
ncbi:MAG: o-succinylbenzoate synthase [Cyanobacteria bacterium REEB459]|nr:o-succinylbenzoate synthase [Cyanobacteria bacterium REEB459]